MRRTASFLYLLAAVIVVILLNACGDNYIFEKKIDIPNAKWLYKDTINFEVNIQDTNKLYNLGLNIEHSATFPFQNVYVNIYTKFPSGERYKKIVNFDLANNEGKWVGNCNSDDCTFESIIQEAAFFNQKGKYIFTIEPFMRQDSLPVKSLTLLLEDTGKNKITEKKK